MHNQFQNILLPISQAAAHVKALLLGICDRVRSAYVRMMTDEIRQARASPRVLFTSQVLAYTYMYS